MLKGESIIFKNKVYELYQKLKRDKPKNTLYLLEQDRKLRINSNKFPKFENLNQKCPKIPKNTQKYPKRTQKLEANALKFLKTFSLSSTHKNTVIFEIRYYIICRALTYYLRWSPLLQFVDNNIQLITICPKALSSQIFWNLIKV